MDAELKQAKIEAGYGEMRELLLYFTGRVENGTIHSRVTYGKFVEALREYPSLDEL